MIDGVSKKVRTQENIKLRSRAVLVTRGSPRVFLWFGFLDLEAAHMGVLTLSKFTERKHKKSHLRGFPGGAVVENLPANAGHYGFEPWSGRIPHAAERLGP